MGVLLEKIPHEVGGGDFLDGDDGFAGHGDAAGPHVVTVVEGVEDDVRVAREVRDKSVALDGGDGVVGDGGLAVAIVGFGPEGDGIRDGAGEGEEGVVVGDGFVEAAVEDDEGGGGFGLGDEGGGIADGAGHDAGGGDEVGAFGDEAVGHDGAGGVATDVGAGGVDGVGFGEGFEEGGEEIEVVLAFVGGVGGDQAVPGVIFAKGVGEDEEEAFGVGFFGEVVGFFGVGGRIGRAVEEHDEGEFGFAVVGFGDAEDVGAGGGVDGEGVDGAGWGQGDSFGRNILKVIAG